MKQLILLLILAPTLFVYSQNGTISGRILDIQNQPLSYVNILLFEDENAAPTAGVTSNDDGSFSLKGLEDKTYRITFSYVGFTTQEHSVSLISEENLGSVILEENTESLDQTVVTAKKPTIQKTAGKLVFNVENSSLSVGSTFDLLKKTPGVLIIGDEIKVKFNRPVIYMNGKRIYLSPQETISLLESLDAATIKAVEVITNPSSKYDAAAGTVLNILTSKAVSIGYKGSINGRYEQATFPKYALGTSHYYKNNWLNFFGSYTYNQKKLYKEDDNFIRFFEPDGSTNSIWNTNFQKITRLEAHQANIVADITLSEKQTLGVTANISVSPDKTFNNGGFAEIFDAQRQLDSTFTTDSFLRNDTSNLLFTLDYSFQLDDAGSKFDAAVNYINYDNEQLQNVSTTYRRPDDSFLRNNQFFTEAKQASDIFTGRADITTEVFDGTFEGGVKYSFIDTDSKLDFFDNDLNILMFNEPLSDDFNYQENIYAQYINFEKEWGKLNMMTGLRGEYTFIRANSRSLGKINNQKYLELFPSVSFHYQKNENNGMGISYKRSIARPHYSSLNPFRYFITENNFNGGNPNLVPSIEDNITLSYDYGNKLFFELYYQNVKNSLSVLTFQDNETRTLQNIDSNIIRDFQYSFDVLFYDSLKPWWTFQLLTSAFYMENEFNSIASEPETYSNNTLGFYAQSNSQFTLSKDGSFSTNLSLLYISNLISGSFDYKNQFNTSISFRKEIWDKRASIYMGVDDIFETFNIPLTSRYYNQDNSYFARTESRLFRVGFKYNFGNARLRDNNRGTSSDESDRLENN